MPHHTTGSCLLAATLVLGGCNGRVSGGTGEAQELVVYNAGSLASPIRALLDSFANEHGGVRGIQEHSGSLEAVRKLTDLGKTPDVVAVADEAIIPALLIPAYTSWQVTFARNSLVLLQSRHAPGDSSVWYDRLLRPGVRVGRADPDRDPSGYRALMAMQLAEAAYGIPGLGKRLEEAAPARYIRPKGADLVALIQSGDLDYAWFYRSQALTLGLEQVPLPDSVSLADPELDGWYHRAVVRVDGAGGSMIDLHGRSIVYAMTIPDKAPHKSLAADFVRFMLSPPGARILEAHGFLPVASPRIHGSLPPTLFPGGMHDVISPTLDSIPSPTTGTLQ